MNKLQVFAGVIATIAVLPIWLFLLYKILVAVEASDLMWFLYIVYIPASFIVQCAHYLTAGAKR